MDSCVSWTLTDVSPPPCPQPWQMLQVDFFGGLGFQPPDRRHHESPSFLPLSFALSPCPGSGGDTGVDQVFVLGEGGDLIFPIVQRTTFVKNVNNRLLYLGLVSGGGGPFPPKMLAAY